VTRHSEGWLLGGRVRHAQPADGHRTGLEPVLLAAAIPARGGERVLEGGTGSAAALLCLAARVPHLTGIGVERDPVMAATARANLATNGCDGIAVLCADLADARPAPPFDHAFANPPWHDPTGTASPSPRREAARRGTPGLFAHWARLLAAPLRPRGTLTLVVAAATLPACLSAFDAAGCGSAAVFPLWPKPGREARLVLVRGIKGGRGPCRVLAGLLLHRADGGFTTAADAILRDGAALVF
jgi:tRNA1(Val) A37 N6-methylase TrmN6